MKRNSDQQLDKLPQRKKDIIIMAIKSDGS